MTIIIKLKIILFDLESNMITISYIQIFEIECFTIFNIDLYKLKERSTPVIGENFIFTIS